MAKVMKRIAWMSVAATALFILLYQIKALGMFFTLAVTAGTVAYHFWMRLFVGGIFEWLLHNQVDYHKKWFRVGKAEQKLYRILKVHKWKKYVPTYDPNAFDKTQHTWQEIASAMCQSELVHETILLLSFVPILFSVWFGAVPVFVLTSVLSALCDLMFVMLQRYNRPRIIKLCNRKQL